MLKEMESRKSSRLGGIAVDFLKKGGEGKVEWFRLSDVFLNYRKLSKDCRVSCIVPFYKKKGIKGSPPAMELLAA